MRTYIVTQKQMDAEGKHVIKSTDYGMEAKFGRRDSFNQTITKEPIILSREQIEKSKNVPVLYFFTKFLYRNKKNAELGLRTLWATKKSIILWLDGRFGSFYVKDKKVPGKFNGRRHLVKLNRGDKVNIYTQSEDNSAGNEYEISLY